MKTDRTLESIPDIASHRYSKAGSNVLDIADETELQEYQDGSIFIQNIR